MPLQLVGAPRFSVADGRSTLSFTVVPGAPYRIGQQVEIGIADPAYYVGITFADAPRPS